MYYQDLWLSLEINRQFFQIHQLSFFFYLFFRSSFFFYALPPPDYITSLSRHIITIYLQVSLLFFYKSQLHPNKHSVYYSLIGWHSRFPRQPLERFPFYTPARLHAIIILS